MAAVKKNSVINQQKQIANEMVGSTKWRGKLANGGRIFKLLAPQPTTIPSWLKKKKEQKSP